MCAMATAPDVYRNFTTSFPVRLRRAAERRATDLGVTRAAYLVSLVCADLVAAGVEPPPPPPPKKNGPRKKDARGA